MQSEPSGPRDDEDETTSITMVASVRVPSDRAKRIRRNPCLVVLTGSNVGETLRLEHTELVLGRSPSSTMRFSDDGISRRHARIWQAEGTGQWMLEDLGSANGTFVNGERVKAHALTSDDKIQIGPSTLVKFTFHDELEENFQRQMYDAALRDGLTKAYNKKYFLARLDTELAYARRHRTDLSLVLLDVDHFKRINDTFGHVAGDAVLVDLAQIVARTVRTEDVFARYGGEEFAVICRNVSCEAAAVMAERLRVRVEKASFSAQEQKIPVTVSLGVAGTPEFVADSSPQLVAAADEALYTAKRTGRNRAKRYRNA
jgi:two-component system, cell cycle response regulator